MNTVAEKTKAAKVKSHNKKPKFLVGLGASAGGLDSLEQFFDHTPTDSGTAFVVVMHLSRDFKSMLDELLARHTGMEVRPALHDSELEADTIYVIQPDTLVEVGPTRLNVETRPDVQAEKAATSIDVLFRSIAENWGIRGGAIVLSGSGSDGAKGLRAVRDVGGFTCAQSPETAKFDPMPIAAIATESVNAVESPDQLGHTVIEGLQLPLLARPSANPPDQALAMSSIVNSVIGHSTIKAEEYKHSTFERRVSRRMMALRISDLTEYAKRVEEDPAEAQKLSQELLIGVTEFFRDEKAFEVIKSQIIPQIINEAHKENRPIRIWVAGCATGEEVYSIAMMFRETLREMPIEMDVQIFATDISKKHLDEATKGQYSKERVQAIPRGQLKRYFDFDEDTKEWVVSKILRKMVVFAQHDLHSDPPFTNLDLICCRNVMIYFSVEAQQRILGGFGFGLRERGFLFLGSSETVGGMRDVFEFIDAKNRIFRRSTIKAPSRSLLRARELFPPSNPPATPRLARRPRSSLADLQPAYSALLADYAPACLLISEDRELLHTFGDANKFLRAPSGMASLDVTELIDQALRTPLMVAIERAAKTNGSLSFTKIAIKETPQEGLMVDLTVRLLPGTDAKTDDITQQHLLVIIDENKNQDAPEESDILSIDADELATSRNSELEEELSRTREVLQSTIEEIETTNEELQASNEELMSANEELMSTNEELSSVNEELYSVNAEYHRQNDDLSRLTNDFGLLLNATQIGVLFLDSKGRITRFTGLTKNLFNLAEGDIGRAITHFNSPFPDLDLEKSLENLPDGAAVTEEETLDRNGHPWLIRLVRDESNFGVVVAIIDIGDLRDAQEETLRGRSMLETIRKMTNSYFIEVDSEYKTVHRQMGFGDFIGEPDLQLPHELSYGNVHPDDVEILQKAMANPELSSGRGDVIYRLFCKPLNEFRYVKAMTQELTGGALQVVVTDVDEISRAEQENRRWRAILDTVLSASRACKAYIDTSSSITFANTAFCRLFNKEASEVIGRQINDILPHNIITQLSNSHEMALDGKGSEVTLELISADKVTLLSVVYAPVMEGDTIIGMVFDGIDISGIAEYAERFTLADGMLASITRHSTLPLMIVGAETGIIDYANKAAQEMLGLASGEFIADRFHISRLTPETGDEGWSDHLSTTLLKGASVINDATVFDGKDATTIADIYLEANIGDEKDLSISVRIVENTEKVMLIEDLRNKARRLSGSNRDLEQFTSAVAHDLRAPLRHITSFSELLESNTEDFSAEEIQNHAGIIANSAQNLSNMVSGLLVYARMGLQDPPMNRCDLAEIMQSAQNNLLDEISLSGAEIIVEGQTSVKGNYDLLVSLFQNLIGNSVKYRKKDEKSKILIEIKQEKMRVSVAVSDNGIGIDPNFSSKIFELFRRLHKDYDYSGLGIGLTTCRRIAEMHKAEIALDTEFKGGSRFVVSNLSIDAD